ncbi:MAG: ATP F0F1 synthase subunit B [Lachnospiraceae bacterium]|nr:ATP F0F1 synthase subunit B [Lachnospiraceae bacterium]
MRLQENGAFWYVSNKIVEGTYEAWWRTERLTSEEWEEIYGEWADDPDEESNSQRHFGPSESEADKSLWYLPNADNFLLTKAEKNELEATILTAARTVSEQYKNKEYVQGASYASNIRNFSNEECCEVVRLLGNAGYVSAADDSNMENYEKVEAFYQAYTKAQDASVIVFQVHSDGLIGVVTFVHREGSLQTYYVGVDWQEGGVPYIKNTLVSNLSKIAYTPKGYLIYTYEEEIVHSSVNQYLRVKPLSDECRELTRKYISGISFANYDAFVASWDCSTVEHILVPCLFEDLYRMHTGEIIRTENGRIPAEEYERIMMIYFPVTKEQLRRKCGYDAASGSYPYEMIFAVPYAPFGEVVDFTQNADGTITLVVDGVWIDKNMDCAFTNKIVVQPFSDGTFRYLSNQCLSQ